MSYGYSLKGLLVFVLFVCIFTVIPFNLHLHSGEFDRLSEPDRKKFSARFEKEIWPLLIRNGKDGCVGCHNPKHRSLLRFSGKPGADFRKILKDGFLLPDDPGSFLHVVSTRNKREQMPPGDRKRWNQQEINFLKNFVIDLDKRQKK